MCCFFLVDFVVVGFVVIVIVISNDPRDLTLEFDQNHFSNNKTSSG